MKDYTSIFNSLQKELDEMMNEVVHTDEDVRRQELRLEQINAKINRCRKELKNKSKLLKQQHNMLKLSPINSQIDNNDN